MNITSENLVNYQESDKINLRGLLWAAPLAMGLASVANTILYIAAGIIAPSVTEWPGAGIGQIVGANIVYLLIGIAAFLVVNRLSSRPARHYLIVATVGLLLSLWLPVSAGMGFGPPEQPGASLATVITLSLMHIISYVISVPLYIGAVNGK